MGSDAIVGKWFDKMQLSALVSATKPHPSKAKYCQGDDGGQKDDSGLADVEHAIDFFPVSSWSQQILELEQRRGYHTVSFGFRINIFILRSAR